MQSWKLKNSRIRVFFRILLLQISSESVQENMVLDSTLPITLIPSGSQRMAFILQKAITLSLIRKHSIYHMMKQGK